MRRALLLVAGLAATSVAGVGLGASSASAAKPIRPCPAASPGLHRYGPGGPAKTVALTFDDGPGRDTARIISILQANHVTATFFNIGEHEATNPALVRTEASDGYAMGDHTWDHQTLTLLSSSQQAGEIDRERATDGSITGAYPCLLRPPGGSYNATTLALANARGMTVWNWSVDTEDWKGVGVLSSYWVDRITTRAEAGGSLTNPVILMHNEVGGNPSTVAALPAIIAYYRTRGYRFVDVRGYSGLPQISAVGPPKNTTAGKTKVDIYGANLYGTYAVKFGTAYGTGIVGHSDHHLSVYAPAHVAGTVDVRLISVHGTSGISTRDHYRYVAPPPPPPPPSSPPPPPTPTPTPTVTTALFLGAGGVGSLFGFAALDRASGDAGLARVVYAPWAVLFTI